MSSGKLRPFCLDLYQHDAGRVQDYNDKISRVAILGPQEMHNYTHYRDVTWTSHINGK